MKKYITPEIEVLPLLCESTIMAGSNLPKTGEQTISQEGGVNSKAQSFNGYDPFKLDFTDNK